MKNVSEVTAKQVIEAHHYLKPILTPTPMIRNAWLSEEYGCEVYLKLETAHPIGSFKIRGATYRIAQLTETEKAKGVVAASAGNHAQGVAWGARHFNTQALIVMPETAPLTKVQSTKALGASIKLEGENYDEAFQAAQKIAQESGKIYVHAFHDPYVISGQGTCALEVLEQCPDLDYVVGSIGGGGLLSGMGLLFKHLAPKVKIIGCQARNSGSMVKSLQSDELTDTPFRGTFADGIAVKRPNPEMFQILDRVVDDTFDCDEDEIAMNVLRLIEKAKLVVEGSGAIVLGALDRFRDQMKGKKVVLIMSGGNIDVNLISRIIDRGLIHSGRRLHLKVRISDRPGSLSKLTWLIASLKANILQAVHDRSEMKLRLDETEVALSLETKGPEHTVEVIRALEEHCNRVTVDS